MTNRIYKCTDCGQELEAIMFDYSKMDCPCCPNGKFQLKHIVKEN